MSTLARSYPDLIWHDDGAKIVLVGQAPSRDTEGAAPFSGRSGRTLERLAGLEPGELPQRFALANVLQRWPGSAGAKGDKFPPAEARKAAASLLEALSGRQVLAVGRATATVLGLPSCRPPMLWFDHEPLAGLSMLPHPSGVNLWWNERRNRENAQTFLRALCAR